MIVGSVWTFGHLLPKCHGYINTGVVGRTMDLSAGVRECHYAGPQPGLRSFAGQASVVIPLK